MSVILNSNVNIIWGTIVWPFNEDKIVHFVHTSSKKYEESGSNLDLEILK